MCNIGTLKKMKYLENDAFPKILPRERDAYFFTRNTIVPVCTTLSIYRIPDIYNSINF